MSKMNNIVLKFNNFEDIRSDITVRDMIERTDGVNIEVVGIEFFVRSVGDCVKVYKMGRDGWIYAGKFKK
jgi:hypothetical protein